MSRDFVNIRAAARQRGDFALADAMTGELERLGYREPVSGAFETAVAEMPERAVPRKGRPKLPRCEHNQIADRCPDCNEELSV